MYVSFFWPPDFCFFIGKGIRNFSRSLLVLFFHPTVYSTNLVDPITNPTIRNVKQPFHVKLPLSQKVQIKRQHKQCFNCPVSSVKGLATKF